MKKAIRINGEKVQTGMGYFLFVLGILIMIAGFVAGFFLGNVEVVKGNYYKYTDTEFSFAVASIYWISAFLAGILFMAFGKVLDLLTVIANREYVIVDEVEETTNEE